MSAAKTSTPRFKKSADLLKSAGGTTTTAFLEPKTVDDAAYLVSTGWARSRNAAINRAVQALADAQRLITPPESM